MTHPILHRIFTILSLLVVHCALGQRALDDLSWKFRDPASNTWSAASVPGNVFLDLQKASKINNPLYSTFEDSVQWVSSINWEYESFPFLLSDAELEKEHIIVRFPGIDGVAKVYLNDEYLFTAENYYRSYEADVKNILKKEGNVIRLEFRSPIEYIEEKAKEYGFTPPGGNAVFIRKPPFHFGWDWGPKLAGVGIHSTPEIIAYDNIFFEDVRVETLDIVGDRATLRTKLSVRSSKKQKVEVQLIAETRLWIAQEINLREGKHDYFFDLDLAEAKLWWTHDLGKPYLYNVEAILYEPKAEKAYSKEGLVGIRTIELITDEDEYGSRFGFKLNGKEIFAKGANYIPQSIFQSEVSESDYFSLIKDARKSNFNMLRVWGGGIYEQDVFYERCNKEGILVWQDFIFACAMYPGDRAFLENVEEEARQQVKRLYGQPCLALWCGNNEISEGWARWGWKDGLSTEEVAKLEQAYRQIFKNILPEIVGEHSELDYWESSPMLGRGDQQHQFKGDAHYWGVWHDAEPFEVLEEKVPRFMSEFGFQSMPELSTWQTVLPNEELYLGSPGIRSHQKHVRGDTLMKEYMSRWYPIPKGLEDFIYLSQLVQAKGISQGIEAHRRNRPYCLGTLYWQYNDCWPVSSWSSRDSESEWKALQYAVKRKYENVLLSATEKEGQLEIYAINDSLHVIDGKLRLTLLNYEGDSLWGKQMKIELGAQSADVEFIISTDSLLQKGNSENLFLLMELEDPVYGIQRSHYYFCTPQDSELKDVDPFVFIEKEEGGYKVNFYSETLIRDCKVKCSKPGTWSDNYFDILPFRLHSVHFETQEVITEDELYTWSWNRLMHILMDKR